MSKNPAQAVLWIITTVRTEAVVDESGLRDFLNQPTTVLSHSFFKLNKPALFDCVVPCQNLFADV